MTTFAQEQQNDAMANSRPLITMGSAGQS